MSEREPKKLPETTIQIKSKFDPSPQGTCSFDGKPLVQQRIDYEIEMHGKLWRVPGVWASVCGTKGHELFAPKVGEAIDERIFEIAFPREAQLGKLLRES